MDVVYYQGLVRVQEEADRKKGLVRGQTKDNEERIGKGANRR